MANRLAFIIIIIDYSADLKKSVWHNITSVCREGEGEDTINNIKQFKVKELECSFEMFQS